MLQNKDECQLVGMRFLKKLRERKGVSQYKMAQLLGMIQQTYIYYESEAKGMKFKTLSRLREVLGLSWDELGKMIDDEAKESDKKTKK